MGARKAHYKSLNTRVLEKDYSQGFEVHIVLYVSHTVNVFVTDIILNIRSQEHLIFTLFQIGLEIIRTHQQRSTCK